MNRLTLMLNIKAINKQPRKVNVRGDLTTRELTHAVKDHFNLDGDYELLIGAERIALPADGSLDQLGVTEGMTIDFIRRQELSNTPSLIAMGNKHRFSQKFRRVYFMEQSAFVEYDLQWWPAIIGRRDRSEPAQNRLLAVDLEALESSPTVSRHHACVTESNGSFFIEALPPRNKNSTNPVYVEGKSLGVGLRYPLATGTTIQVGDIRLNFNVRD